MKKYSLFLLILISIGLQPARSATETYANHDLGFSITVDNTFSKTSQDGDIYHFTKTDDTATVMVRNWAAMKIKTLN